MWIHGLTFCLENLPRNQLGKPLSCVYSLLGCSVVHNAARVLLLGDADSYQGCCKYSQAMVVVVFSQLISGCARTQDGYSKAQLLIQEMKSRDFKQDAVTYGALINVCASHGLEEEARATFEEMQRAGVTPNLFHYSALLNTYACKGKHTKAEQVLGQIRSAGLTPNLVPTFAAFLDD